MSELNFTYKEKYSQLLVCFGMELPSDQVSLKCYPEELRKKLAEDFRNQVETPPAIRTNDQVIPYLASSHTAPYELKKRSTDYIDVWVRGKYPTKTRIVLE